MFKKETTVITLIMLSFTILLFGCTNNESPIPEAEAAESEAAATRAEEPEVPDTPEPLPTAIPEPEEVEPVVSTTFIQRDSDETEVPGAESTLIRMEHGLYATFITSELEPGDVYTMWWMIMNEPENCSDGVCGLDDGFMVDENGDILLVDAEPQLNWAGRARADFAVHRADGSVVDADGSAEFRAHLPIGDMHEMILKSSPLKDPYTAEVHLLIRSHGQPVPGQLSAQLNSPWGGCPEGWPKAPCKNMQLAIHRP